MAEQTASKVPQIRFKGFDGEWKGKALGEAARFRRGSFPQPYGLKKWYDGAGSMPFVQVIDVGSNLSLAEKTKQRISAAAQPKSVFVEKGSVVVTLQGSIGRVALVQYDAYVDRTLLIFKEFTNETDSHFWAHLIQRKFDVEKQRAPGGTIKTITKEALTVFEIVLPLFAEQTKIGEYFRELDSLIGLHQRKHDKLVTLKKAMLQKMFPQPGAATPEIRFKGFSGNWVKRVISEICNETYGGGTPRTSEHKFWQGETPWIQSSDIREGEIYRVTPRKYISDLALRKSPAKLIPANSIAVVTRVGVGKLALIEFSYAASQDFLSLSQLKLDQSFAVIALLILLQSKHHETQGTSIKGITKEDLLAYSLSTPQTIEEQQKIGTYFRTLDSLISKHATQLQKLQQLKSACLEKMFV